MNEIKRVDPRWQGERCIVGASGPSLTSEVAGKVRFARWFDHWRVIAVADAYRRMPWADVLYGSDNEWWDIHKGCPELNFGEKWSSHEQSVKPDELYVNDKRRAAEAYGLHLVRGRDGDEFSFDPSYIRYGSNAGFQALNLALLFGCTQIVLVGFNLCHVNNQAHFFGSHPENLRRTDDHGYRGFAKHFERAAKRLPKHISIVNATPDSALDCFPKMSLEEALAAGMRRQISLPDRDGSELNAAAG